MRLQFLDFDCSEDSQGVVCWDALAQPAARHTPALLAEVTQLLRWAHRFGPQDPGPLEEGADWDFDLQIRHDDVQVHVLWQRMADQLTLTPQPSPDDAISLSLSISGGPAFAQAFRDHWETP